MTIRLIGWMLLSLLLGAGPAWAQTAPGKPTITAVTPGPGSLHLVWTAPSDTGGTAITAYKLRYYWDYNGHVTFNPVQEIWTAGSGALEYMITGLWDGGRAYTVQIQAVNADGDSAWSDPQTATATDHGNDTIAATDLPLETAEGGFLSVEGILDSSSDTDYFKVELSAATDILIRSLGDLDTQGELLDSVGRQMTSNNDGGLTDAPQGFFLWRSLVAGTYYLKVSGQAGATGHYVLVGLASTDTESRSDAAALTINPLVNPGTAAAEGIINPDDTDYFKVELSETTDLAIRGAILIHGFDLEGELSDSTSMVLGQGGLTVDPDAEHFLTKNFLIRQHLEAGVYYLKVAGSSAQETGPYYLTVFVVQDPGDGTESLGLDSGALWGGRIDTASDVDRFSMEVEGPTYVEFQIANDTVRIDGRLIDASLTPVETYILREGNADPTVTILGYLPTAGTYSLEMTGDGSTTGAYTFLAKSGAAARFRAARPPPPPPGGRGGSSGGGSSGGGGSGSRPEDLHGNTPAQASEIPLGTPPWTAAIAGQLTPADDVDYFTLPLPHAGVLVVETTGRTDTVGTVWQAGQVLAMADSGGVRQNFRLEVPVEAGAVVVAITGNGRRTGAYTLEARLVAGYLENPGADSFQSGIGVLSGWTCAAEGVEVVLETAQGMPLHQVAAYGTERVDTERVCGDTDNGFGLLFNWNLLGDGEHTVVAYVDDIELGRAAVTVTTLDEEFVRDVTGTCTVEDFPVADKSVTVVWQQTKQNFVIAGGEVPTGENRAGMAEVGYLENPGPNSFQSGIGVISGWVCTAETVEITLGDLPPQRASYGTERLDTEEACGDTDNGFGLLFNWNLLGAGEHEVVASVDDMELGRATVWVTTLGVEFLRNVEGECMVEDFPMEGETITLEWQQTSQNFVITQVE